jgi:hypothetical protein
MVWVRISMDLYFTIIIQNKAGDGHMGVSCVCKVTVAQKLKI